MIKYKSKPPSGGGGACLRPMRGDDVKWGDTMSSWIDLVILTDKASVVWKAWWNHELPAAHGPGDFDCWAGLPLAQLPEMAWDFSAHTMEWRELRFQFERLPLTPDLDGVFLRRENIREQLMEAALDTIETGIQLYDVDSTILFFNRASKQLVDIPLEENVEGQTLMDIYAVDPDYSSTMTAMRIRAPVRRRFDTYKSTTGKEMMTVTSAFPVIKEGRLLGGVALERSQKITQQQLQDLQQIQQTMTRHLSAAQSTDKRTRYTLRDVIGSSPQLLAAIDLAAKMAPKEINILIQGETGTGKEIFAQGIHALSSRRNEKFVAVNCAAFPESLIEGMLFGTVKGAFTGSTDKVGLIEEANHGTLFLDELNSMSLGMQAKLLRVLQEKTLQRVGSTKYISVDIRVISSCNEDAYALSESGQLRKDLFYRLASVIVEIPPLRERMEDMEVLTWHYIHRNEEICAQPITQVDPAFWRRLQQHNWPGNVRELFHILHYAISDSEGGVLREENLPSYFRKLRCDAGQAAKPAAAAAAAAKPDFRRGLTPLVQEYERYILREAYLSCGKNATKAAALLKLSRQNFQYYVKKYGLHE